MIALWPKHNLDKMEVIMGDVKDADAIKAKGSDLNILFCHSVERKTLGTYSVHIYEVISNLSRLGHHVVAVSTDIQAIEEGIDEKKQFSFWKRQNKSLRSSAICRRLEGELTILWCFFKEIHIFLLLFAVIVKHKGRFDVIYRRHTLFNCEYLLGKVFKIPSIKEVNGIIVDEAKITKRRDSLSLRIIDWIETFNLPKADKVIVVTSKLKEVLEHDYKLSEDKIVVITNGANVDLFKPMAAIKARERLGLNQNNNYICFVGNLAQWQGLEYLIRCVPHVLNQCPDTRFLIVGDGVMKQELTELAEQIGVSDRVIFVGKTPYERVPLYINAGDVCVAPFVRKRNERIGVSPLKLCEYMACGKPVVASNISGIGHLLRTVRAGIVVEPESPQVLAQAITELLQDGDLRKQMGENGRKYVVQNQSWESVARRVAEVCQQTMEERKNKCKQK